MPQARSTHSYVLTLDFASHYVIFLFEFLKLILVHHFIQSDTGRKVAENICNTKEFLFSSANPYFREERLIGRQLLRAFNNVFKASKPAVSLPLSPVLGSTNQWQMFWY